MSDGHKERFDALLSAAIKNTKTTADMQIATTDTSIEYWDEASQTWYEPITGIIRRYPTMFDFQREQQEADWPHAKLEARWREICEQQAKR